MAKTTRRPGVRSLNTTSDAQRLQAKLIKQFIAGDLPESKLRAATYALLALAKLIEGGQNEERMAEIERQLAELDGGRV